MPSDDLVRRVITYRQRNRRAKPAEIAYRLGCSIDDVHAAMRTIEFGLEAGPVDSSHRRQVARYIRERCQEIQATWSAEEETYRRTGVFAMDQQPMTVQFVAMGQERWEPAE